MKKNAVATGGHLTDAGGAQRIGSSSGYLRDRQQCMHRCVFYIPFEKSFTVAGTARRGWKLGWCAWGKGSRALFPPRSFAGTHHIYTCACLYTPTLTHHVRTRISYLHLCMCIHQEFILFRDFSARSADIFLVLCLISAGSCRRHFRWPQTKIIQFLRETSRVPLECSFHNLLADCFITFLGYHAGAYYCFMMAVSRTPISLCLAW